MAPKKARGVQKKVITKRAQDIPSKNSADDANVEALENGTYKRQAKLLETALKEQKPSLTIAIQPYGKPRTGKGTFNVYLVKDKKETLIWDGKSKGPPRKLKFPEVETILEALIV
ncbi:hypothetical protein GpartN1_g6754.t1 [Galdieria partita]|uniref:Selenoprotein H n=1 Tax=Galdieria partita TaxID=83374 RepID=A0A9C7UTL2_9RHOD|nr:hypothetical protein GpartN1_g6754.t1 [Galdieria partita]